MVTNFPKTALNLTIFIADTSNFTPDDIYYFSTRGTFLILFASLSYCYVIVTCCVRRQQRKGIITIGVVATPLLMALSVYRLFIEEI